MYICCIIVAITSAVAVPEAVPAEGADVGRAQHDEEEEEDVHYVHYTIVWGRRGLARFSFRLPASPSGRNPPNSSSANYMNSQRRRRCDACETL